MQVSIIGCGVVGNALKEWLNTNNKDIKLSVFDPKLGCYDQTLASKVCFISVPIPIKSFKQDLSLVNESILRCNKDAIIFIRSTVLPGTCDELSRIHNKTICSMPEFLTERRAVEDFDKHDVIFGYPENMPKNYAIYQHMNFIFGDKKDLHYMANKECEMTKYMHNCFGAFKVTYFNAFKKICDKHGIDFVKAKEHIFDTGFINKEHTMVPGPDGNYGYGGKCFPENIESMIGFVGTDPEQMLFKDIHCLNRFYRGDKKLN